MPGCLGLPSFPGSPFRTLDSGPTRFLKYRLCSANNLGHFVSVTVMGCFEMQWPRIAINFQAAMGYFGV